MRGFAVAVILMLTLAGCSSPDRGLVYVARGPAEPANLALGPLHDHTILSELHAYRSSWPSIESGFFFDDVSTYTEVLYDDQSHYSTSDGGGFMREAVSIRRGVMYR